MTKNEKNYSARAKKPPEGFIRMNINLPRTFYKEIQHRALDEDMTITELVITAVKDFLSKKKY